MKSITAGFFLISLSGLSLATLSNEINLNQKLSQESHLNHGSFVVVGGDFTDPECEFFTIQSAINSGANSVRIATGFYQESLLINDRSLELLGGYSTCTQAANMNGFFPNEIAVINADNGNFTEPGITILGSSSRHQVTLRNLKIEEGKGVALTPGGGISTFGADLELNILNLELINNEGILGGGMSILSGNTDVDAVNLLVRNNTAQAGGGIHCSGEDVSIVLSDNDGALRSGIRDNQATDGDGGGIKMENGCQLTTYTGTSSSSSSDLRGITSNEALDGNGGGVALDSGSQIFLMGVQECVDSVCMGNNNHPINININSAQSDLSTLGLGGGIYATGEGTKVTAKGIEFSRNMSQRAGGGAYIGPNASFNLSRAPLPCWNEGLCNQIDLNRAGTSGGGISVTASSNTSIAYAHFQNNRANLGTAAFVSLGLTDTSAKISHSIFSGNGDNGSGVYQDNNVIYSASNLEVSFSTFADNSVQGETFFQRSTFNANQLELRASIIHSPGINVYRSIGSSSSLVADCLVVNEDSSFSGNNVIEESPDFIDRVNGDYHITETSPAIDMCGLFGLLDMDDQTRGYNFPGTVNIDGPYDAGVDEYVPEDLIFANGFELFD